MKKQKGFTVLIVLILLILLGVLTLIGVGGCKEEYPPELVEPGEPTVDLKRVISAHVKEHLQEISSTDFWVSPETILREEESSAKPKTLFEMDLRTPYITYMEYREANGYVQYNGYIQLGLAKEQLIAIWGRPEDINRSTGRWGVHEQWMYSSRDTYVYFENGILTSWQN